jgi:hypothetical protein
MAYQIDRYNNTVLTVVQDGTIDQTTDLKFIGKNYAGYGEIQNENFLYLLENFAGANEPPRAISGQIWFDSAGSKLKFYDGTKWRTTGGSEVAGTEPTGLTEGDFWWDAANDQLYVYNGTDFILIGPQNAGEGLTQMVSSTVLDASNNPHSIIQATLEDEVVYIISKDEFTLGAVNPITGFSVIKQGITLVNTPATGVNAGVTSSAHRYWGTASNALKLGGLDAASYVTTTPGVTTEFDSQVSFPDDGIAVGESLDFKFFVENGDEGVISNETGSDSLIKIKVTDGTGTLQHIATFNNTGMVPAADNSYDIGTSTFKWATIYANTFNGEATRATALREGSNFRTASQSAVGNTVAVRTATADLVANLFQGTATQARYADLAEKYSTAEELIPGTVVTVCAHEGHEVEAANRGDIAIGVVSTDPAVMMNSEAEGQYIGLKGRLPVRVIGAVKKGDAVYVDDKGCASTAINGGSLVGVALESNSDEGEKLVECVLKV